MFNLLLFVNLAIHIHKQTIITYMQVIRYYASRFAVSIISTGASELAGVHVPKFDCGGSGGTTQIY